MTEPAAPWETLGLNVARVVRLSRNGAAGAFRLDLTDGTALKARVFPTPHWASRVDRLLAFCPDSLLPTPLRRDGRVLVAEFVPGTPLDERLREAPAPEHARRARAAGRLMARLHASRSPPGRSPSPERYRRHLVAVAHQLQRAGMLEDAEVSTLCALQPPARARSGLTHGDICPENLILVPGGRLRAIDEERLAVRPLAYDLARSVNRWPLGPRLERAFLEGYADAGGHAEGFRRWRTFWVAAALASSAGYRLARDPRSLGPTLVALRALVRAAARADGPAL